MTHFNFALQLLDPRGRCNRRGLLVLALALLAIQAALGVAIWRELISIQSPLVMGLKVLFIWLAFTAAAKRLHDAGKSSLWIVWTALFVVVWTFIVAAAALVLVGPEAAKPDGPALWVMMALVLMPILVATLWLHFKPGDIDANRFGLAPGDSGFAGPRPAVSIGDQRGGRLHHA